MQTTEWWITRGITVLKRPPELLVVLRWYSRRLYSYETNRPMTTRSRFE